MLGWFRLCPLDCMNASIQTAPGRADHRGALSTLTYPSLQADSNEALAVISGSESWTPFCVSRLLYTFEHTRTVILEVHVYSLQHSIGCPSSPEPLFHAA